MQFYMSGEGTSNLEEITKITKNPTNAPVN